MKGTSEEIVAAMAMVGAVDQQSQQKHYVGVTERPPERTIGRWIAIQGDTFDGTYA